MRLTWLADKLAAAGLTVIETAGWRERGSDTFNPIGVTWHATAGRRDSTDAAEVRVLIEGRTGLPGPISQIYIDRDGWVYLIAAGRANHNLTGWDGPNEGLGNTQLLGIEMKNDNRGQDWPAVQLDAARLTTAVIMAELDADPMERLAAHYEHQPYATRPPGQGSTKSDPYGVDMDAERPRVAKLIEEGWDMPLNKTDAITIFTSDDTIGVPTWHSDYAKGNKKWAAATAIRECLNETHRVGAAVAAQGEVIAKLLTAVLAIDTVDEVQLVQDLAPALAAAIVALLPEDRDDVSTDELVAAIRIVVGAPAA